MERLVRNDKERHRNLCTTQLNPPPPPTPGRMREISLELTAFCLLIGELGHYQCRRCIIRAYTRGRDFNWLVYYRNYTVATLHSARYTQKTAQYDNYFARQLWRPWKHEFDFSSRHRAQTWQSYSQHTRKLLPFSGYAVSGFLHP